MANEKLFHIGVKALIENNEGKVLVLLASLKDHHFDTEPYWDIPGGRIQEGETVLETLKREVKEELGVTELRADPVFVTAVVSNHQVMLDDGLPGGLLLMVYRVTLPDDAQIVMSEEHTEYEWVETTEAAKRLSHKYPAEFTEKL